MFIIWAVYRICCNLELEVSLTAAIAVDIRKVWNSIYSKFSTLPELYSDKSLMFMGHDGYMSEVDYGKGRTLSVTWESRKYSLK